jgi:polyhydroxyalkanoate synthesis regulator protein
MVPGYLEASMESFRRNQQQFKSAVEGAFANSPFAEMAKRNMEIFEAATHAFKQGTPGAPGGAPGAAPAGAAAPVSEGDDVAAQKAEHARLQDKIEKLAK